MNVVPNKVLDALSASTSSLKTLTTSITNSAASQPQPLLFSSATNTIVESIGSALGVTTGRDSISSSDGSASDCPNEYRDLLISLSGQKSDHILWIECLKQYHWEGDASVEFTFILDKFGVPALRNGDYKLNICYDCLDLMVERQKADESASSFDGFSLIWEGNYWDSSESVADDSAHLTAESLAIVIRKCANVLRQLFSSQPHTTNGNESVNPAKGRPVVVYMPNVVQLFVVQMAAARVGAVLTIVNATINRDPQDLAEILELAGTELVITVDGFFMGEELQQTKAILDEAIHILHTKTENRINKVVVVRHIGPNPNIPPPTSPFPVGRRPHYGLEVPFEPGRDFHWSNLMLQTNDECDCEWMESEDIIFNTIRKVLCNNNDSRKASSSSYATGVNNNNDSNNSTLNQNNNNNSVSERSSGRWHFESYTLGQIALLVRLISRTLRSWSHTIPAATGPVWPLVEADDLLFLSSLFAIPLAGFALFMCESPPTHPNPSRIFHFIEKHGVKQLLISESYTKLLIRNDDFQNVWQQAGDPMWSSSSLEMVYSVSKSRRENEEFVEWFQKCIPTANIMHLSC